MKTEFYESEIVVKGNELFPLPADEPKEVLREKWLLDGDMTFDQAKKIAVVLAEEVYENRQVTVKVQNAIDKDWIEILYYVQGKRAISAETAEQEAKDPTDPKETEDHPRGRKKTNVLELPDGKVPPSHERRDK